MASHEEFSLTGSGRERGGSERRCADVTIDDGSKRLTTHNPPPNTQLASVHPKNPLCLWPPTTVLNF